MNCPYTLRDNFVPHLNGNRYIKFEVAMHSTLRAIIRDADLNGEEFIALL